MDLQDHLALKQSEHLRHCANYYFRIDRDTYYPDWASYRRAHPELAAEAEARWFT